MNQFNPLTPAPPLQSSEKAFNQATQNGTNQISLTEYNQAVGLPNLSGHLQPSTVWGRWFVRWIGLATVGAVLPILTRTPIGLAAPVIALALLALGAGYVISDRRATGVVLVCGAALAIGFVISFPAFIALLIGA
jgi:hypothetical protein